MELRTEVSEIADWSIVTIYGELDVATAPTLRERLIALVGEGSTKLVLDLEGVDFLDSTGLGTIISALKTGPHPWRRHAPRVHTTPHQAAVRDHRSRQGGSLMPTLDAAVTGD